MSLFLFLPLLKWFEYCQVICYHNFMSMTQYTEADKIIIELEKAIQQKLGVRLGGLYIFGSLVGGDFDMQTSDMDLLAMVETDVTEPELVQLRDMHEAFALSYPEWENRIEVDYVSKDAMRNFKTSTHQIVRISPGEPLHYRDDMGMQWLMDWHMVQEQGVTVTGPKPQEFIPHIEQQEYMDSIKNIMPSFADAVSNAKNRGYQSYIILSLCRNLYALKFGYQTSKPAGGKWAAQEYPDWTHLIENALKWKGSSDMSDKLTSQAETRLFAEFALKQVG